MIGGALGSLIRHPVHPWLFAPALAVGVTAGLVLRLLAELRQQAVADGVQVSVLLLAMTTLVAVVDPAGTIADATPTPQRTRRTVRVGLVLVAVAVGGVLALLGPPSTLRPPVGSLTVDLATLCAGVLGAAAVEARAVPRTTDPIGAAVGVAMAWAALWLLRPSWSPFASAAQIGPGLGAVAGAALLALGLASADPARPCIARGVVLRGPRRRSAGRRRRSLGSGGRMAR